MLMIINFLSVCLLHHKRQMSNSYNSYTQILGLCLTIDAIAIVVQSSAKRNPTENNKMQEPSLIKFVHEKVGDGDPGTSTPLHQPPDDILLSSTKSSRIPRRRCR